MIQSLPNTIGAGEGLVVPFDGFRKKRNIADYERAGVISEQEAAEMVALARELRRDIEAWLRREYPELV